MGRRSLRPRGSRGGADDDTGQPADGKVGKKRKSEPALTELSTTPRTKKKKSHDQSDRGKPATRGRGRGGRGIAKDRGSLDTPPSTPSTGRKGRGASGKRGRGRGRGRPQMVLDDDDDRDYIDYESPEELPVYEEEDAQIPEDDDQESTTADSQSDLESESDVDFDGASNPRCPSDALDESSMEPLEVWRDDSRHFPELELPSSSLDLLIPPSSMLLDALSVYESLRYFTQPLK